MTWPPATTLIKKVRKSSWPKGGEGGDGWPGALAAP